MTVFLSQVKPCFECLSWRTWSEIGSLIFVLNYFLINKYFMKSSRLLGVFLLVFASAL